MSLPIIVIKSALTPANETEHHTPRTSWPSLPVNFCMIPPPEGVYTELIYNFYTPDESVNFGGYDISMVENDEIVNILSQGDGAYAPNPGLNSYLQQIKTQVPRYVQINFTTPAFPETTTWNVSETPISNQAAEDNETLIRSQLGSILDDSALGTTPSNKFVSLALQSNDLALSLAREFSLYRSLLGQQFFDNATFFLGVDSLVGTGYADPTGGSAKIASSESGVNTDYLKMGQQALSKLQDPFGDTLPTTYGAIRAGESVF
jgi:hypothetical protein